MLCVSLIIFCAYMIYEFINILMRNTELHKWHNPEIIKLRHDIYGVPNTAYEIINIKC